MRRSRDQRVRADGQRLTSFLSLGTFVHFVVVTPLVIARTRTRQILHQFHLQVCKEPSKRANGKKTKRRLPRGSASVNDEGGEVDYTKKILHMSWHPQDDIMAVAGNDKLYIYTAQR